jgi:hypothetical protein
MNVQRVPGRKVQRNRIIADGRNALQSTTQGWLALLPASGVVQVMPTLTLEFPGVLFMPYFKPVDGAHLVPKDSVSVGY